MTGIAPADDLVVLGFGSALMHDDGVAFHALDQLARSAAVPAGVRFVDAGTSGPATLAEVRGARRLLVLDAVDAGGPPGAVVRIEVEGSLGSDRRPTAHELGLAVLLDDLRLLGEPPERVVLLGVQPAQLAPGRDLSPEVRAGLERLVAAAEQELRTWARGRPSEAEEAPRHEERWS